MTPPDPSDQAFPPQWWESFFESPDSLPLSFFPTPGETEAEVEGLLRLLDLPAGSRLADVCCGTGRHLVRLLQRGYQAVGVDISAMMLGRAREEARARGLPAPLVRADARHLPFRPGCFDAVLNLFNSFGYCEADEENEQVLREAARVLKPGGQFLLETRNPQYQILFAPVRQRVQAADGSLLVVSWRYDRQRRRLHSEWRRPRTGRVVHRASIRLYQLEELRAMLNRTGLQETGLFSGYGGEPFDGWERVVLWRGRKQ